MKSCHIQCHADGQPVTEVLPGDRVKSSPALVVGSPGFLRVQVVGGFG